MCGVAYGVREMSAITGIFKLGKKVVKDFEPQG